MGLHAGALAALLALPVTASAQVGPPPGEQEIGLLFAQTAKRGSFEPQKDRGKHRFALKLEGVSPQTVWFQDRPGRQTGQILVRDFVRSWAGFGFAEDNPNAALTVLDAHHREDTVVVELGEPRYRAKTNTLRYPAHRLDEATGNLAHLEHARDHRVAQRFDAASLFIDDADGPVVNGCVIQPWTQCSGADLAGANLFQAELAFANLSGANLTHAELGFADLTNANLYRADLTGADLTRADLTDAFLFDANLFEANLTGAILTNANLAGAELGGANLGGATFCGTTMPDGSQDNQDC